MAICSAPPQIIFPSFTTTTTSFTPRHVSARMSNQSPKPTKRYNVFVAKVCDAFGRCGFTKSQEAYDRAVNEIFNTLDEIEDHFGSNRERLTLADVCLFTTLIRFDPVYNILFKCTKKKLFEYADIYQILGVAATCDLPAIMDGYYKTLFPLNASGIQPAVSLSGDQESLL